MSAGRWDQLGVPHKGWRCVDVVDLRADGETADETEYATCQRKGGAAGKWPACAPTASRRTKPITRPARCVATRRSATFTSWLTPIWRITSKSGAFAPRR